MSYPTSKWTTAKRKSNLAILAACLLLLVYIGFLMTSNYRSQKALHESTLKRFHLDLEKRVAALGYFFSERKYDLGSMAVSREVYSYFVNKSLGMSEQYGLKVNYFIIEEMLKKALVAVSIRGDRIYERIVFTDRSGHGVADTDPKDNFDLPPALWPNPPAVDQSEPVIHIDRSDGSARILMAAPCFYRDEFAGALIAWLNLRTLFAHFVDFSPQLSQKNFHLIVSSGQLICPPDEEICLFAREIGADRLARIPQDGFSFFTFFSDTEGRRKLLVTRLPIDNTPLSLMAGVYDEVIFGSLAPWQLLVGTGFLAMAIVMGIGVLIRFNTQNLILKARFDESERQQGLLAFKNIQLQDEISKRLSAERELEKQRTLRIRSDRLRSLGEMAAGMAHELNQPLSGVRGLAELILLSMDSDRKMPEEQVRGYAGKIVDQADRMVHIINHVRLFAREAGSPRTSLVDLNDVVQSGIGLLSAQFKSHGLLLETELARESLPVRANPFSLEEVIFNLLNNARDAMENRSQREDSSYTPRVVVTTWRENGQGRDTIQLQVRDNGTGIPQANVDKVFDPFFTTKDPDKGTGLGLSISRAIIEELGGSIQFVSTEAEGTVFTIHLPAYTGERFNDEQCQEVEDTYSG